MVKISRASCNRLLACWGNGDFGRLGHGVMCFGETAPRICSFLSDLTVAQASCGGAHTVVVTGITPGLQSSLFVLLAADFEHVACRRGVCFQHGTERGWAAGSFFPGAICSSRYSPVCDHLDHSCARVFTLSAVLNVLKVTLTTVPSTFVCGCKSLCPLRFHKKCICQSL